MLFLRIVSFYRKTMTEQKNAMKKLLLGGLFLFLTILSLSAQDSLYIYKNGQIIYSSQTDQIDSAAFHPPGYWAEQRSEVIFSKIKSYPELSIFADLLVQSGYQTKLDNTTIWAPTNAALADFDRNNPDQVRQLVENHLSTGLFLLSPALLELGKVTMHNQKRMNLTMTGNDYFLDGNKILTRNIQAPSGLLNILDGFIPYRPTLWEYVNQASITDSMCLFVRSFTKKTYDSVTKDSIYTNALLTNVAASLKLETVEYTVLIPDNKLWNETVNHLMQFYTSTTDSAVTAARLNNVKRIILKDLFIQGRKKTLVNDTLLLTTLGNDLNDPTQLFGKDSLLAILSNGNCQRISALNHLNAALKEIRVEAENAFNRTSSNTRIYTKYKASTLAFPISNDAYIDAFPLTTSSIQPVWVQYSIPNLLPGKYNIYVVFVPTYLEDTTKILPFKANCYLTYPNSEGAIQTNVSIYSNAITAPKNISKFLVKSDFEVNFFDFGLAGATNPMIKLKVQNAATSAQTTLYNREILTDCILFEPVQ